MTTSHKTENWSAQICGHSTSFAVTRAGKISIVAITQVKGFGSVFDASSAGVACLVGARRDGMEEAFTRALTSALGSDRVILTLALRDYSPQVFKEMLQEIKKFQ